MSVSIGSERKKGKKKQEEGKEGKRNSVNKRKNIVDRWRQ